MPLMWAGEFQKLDGQKRSIYAVAFSPDGRIFASAGGARYPALNNIEIWNPLNGELLHELRGYGDVRCIAFYPDIPTMPTRMLASCTDDGTVRLWDLSTGQERRVLTGDRYNHLSISPEGLLAYKQDSAIAIWNESTNEMLQHSFGFSTVHSFTFNPNPEFNILAVCGDKEGVLQVELWDRVGIELIGTFLPGGAGPLDQMVFSLDGKLLATVTSKNGVSVEVKLWSCPNGDLVREMPSFSGLEVAFIPGETLLAYHSMSSIGIWDLETGHKTVSLRLHTPVNPSSIAISPDGRILALGCFAGFSSLWDMATLKVAKPEQEFPEVSGCVASTDADRFAWVAQR